MHIELLLSGLFILLVLGLFAAAVYSLFITLHDARIHDALAPNTPGQQRFLTATILNYLTQLEE